MRNFKDFLKQDSPLYIQRAFAYFGESQTLYTGGDTY